MISYNNIHVSALPVTSNEHSSSPTPVRLRNEATEDGIVLTWAGILGAELSGFKIYRAYGDAAPIVLKTVASTATSYTDTAVKKAHTYRYLISTVGDKKAESEMSREIQITY